MSTKKIKGFHIEIDKTPPLWHGSVFLRHTKFKEEAHYVTSKNPSFLLAIWEIVQKYGEQNLKRIDIKEYEE